MKGWIQDQGASRIVESHSLFASHGSKPQVHRDAGGNVYIDGTPYGDISLVRWRQGRQRCLLVAAQHPPRTYPGKLPAEVQKWLQDNDQLPWARLPDDDASLEEVLDRLEKSEAPAAVVPFLKTLPVAPGKPIGDRREKLVATIAKFLSVPGSPLPLVYGPRGAGARTLAGQAVARAGFRAVGDIPMGRLLHDRKLASPTEVFHQTLDRAQKELNAGEALLFSGVEQTKMIVPVVRENLFDEIRVLPAAILAARGVEVRFLVDQHEREVIRTFRVPGFGLAESRELAAQVCPTLEFTEAAFQLLARASTHEDWKGILPGKLVQRMMLVERYIGGGRKTAYPDDVAEVLSVMEDGW